MTRASAAQRFFDFSGGLNTYSPVQALKFNEAIDLQNINLLPDGGFEGRRGNTAFNSSAMVSSSTAISGLAYFRLANNNDFVIAIAGTKIFTSPVDGTMTDRTGIVTITAGQDNLWTHSVLNNLSIWVGGAPDAPIKWSGSGNAAALGGSPVTANFGISAGNRLFIGNTTANPSTIYWSALGDPETWTGSGTGSQDVFKNDGDNLIGATVLNNDVLLLFKQNSISQLQIRNSPFPLFPLFQGVGAISKRGIVVVDGIAYFITPTPRMKATDGTQVFDFPDTINGVWDGLNRARLSYIHGIYYSVLKQIHWFVSNGTSATHNLSIIWDLERKCWLRHPTGFKMNSSAYIWDDAVIYTGAYDGKVYKQDVASTYTDASETAPGAISAYWRSGWYDFGNMVDMKVIPYVQASLVGQTTGTIEIGYGYDFVQDKNIAVINETQTGDKWGTMFWGTGKWGGQSDLVKQIFTKGKGKYFQFLIRKANDSQQIKFNGLEIPVKKSESTILR